MAAKWILFCFLCLCCSMSSWLFMVSFPFGNKCAFHSQILIFEVDIKCPTFLSNFFIVWLIFVVLNGMGNSRVFPVPEDAITKLNVKETVHFGLLVGLSFSLLCIVRFRQARVLNGYYLLGLVLMSSYHVLVSFAELSGMRLNILENYVVDVFINVHSFFWCLVYMYVTCNYMNLRFMWKCWSWT